MLAVASLGGAEAAFQLDGQLAVADGINVTDYTLALTGFAGAKGRIAGVSGDGDVHVFDLSSGNDTAYKLPGAAYVTFDNNAKVVAATSSALYGEGDDGGLSLLIDLSGTTVHGLAGSPSGVWVAMDTEVGLLTGTTLGQSTGANLPADATIVASSSGDVWALSQGELLRYSANSPGDESLWNATILPIFDEVSVAVPPAGRHGQHRPLVLRRLGGAPAAHRAARLPEDAHGHAAVDRDGHAHQRQPRRHPGLDRRHRNAGGPTGGSPDGGVGAGG